MANSWHSFEPTQFFPAPLQHAVSALDTAFGTVAKAGHVVEKALRIASALSARASTNPVESALRTATSQIDKFIEGIVGEAQCHAIVIPIRKRVLRRTTSKISHLDDFLSPSEPAYAFVQRALTNKGGPGVFYRTLVESVSDSGDINRPDFPSDYAVVGACVLAGSETLSDLQIPFRLFTTLFVGNQRIAPSANTLPVVQNLRVTPAALRGGTGVILRWTPLPPVTNIPLFTSDVIVAKEIFLIQTSRPFQQGFLTWDDLFNGVQPSDSLTDLQEKNGSKVIARIRNHGLVTSYTDTTHLLDPKKTYYFTACVRYTVNGEVQPMGALSNVVRVVRRLPQPSTRQATPPDWFSTPTLTRMFPPLDQAINQVRLGVSRLGALTATNTGSQQLLQQTIAQLQRLVTQWETVVEETQEVTARLQAITSFGTPSGMYSTTIASSTGGMEGWLAELARRMSDTTDSSRPDLSDQSAVIGFVIVAGAPRLPDLSAVRALIELFFGSHPKNPLFTTLQQFDGNLGSPIAPPAASPPILGYDAAMLPSTTPTC